MFANNNQFTNEQGIWTWHSTDLLWDTTLACYVDRAIEQACKQGINRFQRGTVIWSRDRHNVWAPEVPKGA